MVAGVGLRRECSAGEIVALVRRAAAQAGRAPSVLAAPAFKRGEALDAAAAELGLALVLVEEAALAAVQPACVTHSRMALRRVGVGSVAEGSALAAAGVGGRLVLARIASGAATCALAERAEVGAG